MGVGRTVLDENGRCRADRGLWRGVGAATALGLMVGLLAGGCSGAKKTAGEPDAELGQTDAQSSADEAEKEAAARENIELGPITKQSMREHPAGVAWVFSDDPSAPEKMSIARAEATGYTVIDLSDTWVPYIFTEKTPGLEDSAENRYRKTYIGLANDEIDLDGDALPEWDKNFLELYGIPPSLSVIKEEWDSMDADLEPCLQEAGYDPSVFEDFKGVIAYRNSGQNKRNRSAAWFKSKLDKAMRKARLDPKDPADLEKAASLGSTKRWYVKWRELQHEIDIIDHAQRRFRCEKLFNTKGGAGDFQPGVYDSATTHALANFERKHDIMGWGHFKNDNLAMLALTPQQAVHARLLRTIQERVVSSAGIVEDGSAARWKKKFTYQDEQGIEHALRDVVGESTQAAIEALGLQTPESAKQQLSMLSDLGEGDFKNLLIAVELPEKPPYYAENMEFSAVIDRGDVWYDFPYNELGEKLSQPRRRYPHLTVYVHYNDQKIPLMHWRTTIGSWRPELHDDGDVYLKYKNSDVGERVWKDIVAAPVWIPPTSTPPGELIKGKWKNGKFRTGVSYDQIGPGYRSAYGLVAAYHIKQIFDEEGNLKHEFDNSIRTHGSVDYMSILRRFSHGCHRLYNMDAVRLFSFILRHRDYTRHGQQPVGVSRDITYEEKTYRMSINTRGYKYELVEPIPVSVTKGRIKGRRKRPIEEYMKKPVPPEENAIEVEDDEGNTLSMPVPLPPPLLP